MNSLPANFPAANMPETDLYKMQWFYRKYAEEYYAEYGFGHYLLAAYAAVPMLLTPDLLYTIWQNFSAYKWAGDPVSIHRIAVPDVLLSPLCREIGFELYEMHPEIRMALLQWLHTEAATPIWIKREVKTVTQIAAFVEYYYTVPKAAGLRWGAGYVEIQLLDAKSFSNPGEVAAVLLKKLQQAAGAAQESEMLRVMDLFVKTKKRLERLGGKDSAAFRVFKGQAEFMEAWKSLIQKNNTSFTEQLKAKPELRQLLTATNNGGIEIKITDGVVENSGVAAQRKVLVLCVGVGPALNPVNQKKRRAGNKNAFENSAQLIAGFFKEFIPAAQLNIKLLKGKSATKAGILQAWAEWCHIATENDDLFFYLAANAAARDGSCFVECSNSKDFKHFSDTWLADADIKNSTANCKSKAVTAIIESDYAGTGNWLDISKSNHIILASCKHQSEAGNYMAEEIQNSDFAFTTALVQSLRVSQFTLPVRDVFAEMLRHYEMFVREAGTYKTQPAWTKQVPQLISSRHSYNYVWVNGGNLTAQLQDLLRQCGYADATSTGKWNRETASELSRFCKEARLSKNLSKQEYITRLIANTEKYLPYDMPAFVLIFSDPSGRLKMQPEERAKIVEITQAVAASIQIILLDNPDKTVLINTLKEKVNRNRIELIYYSGNDDKGNFILKDGSFTIADFAPLLAYQDNIKLLVSNTCNSAYFAETVTQLGVAAAIGSGGKIMDDVGAQYGELLFKWITEGNVVEKFPDHFSRNRNSSVSEGDFLFYRAGWFPTDSVISWEKYVGPKSDESGPEVYSLVIGCNYGDASDSRTEKNTQLMNTWLQNLPNRKENKLLVNTRSLPFNKNDLDKAVIDLFEKAGQSTDVKKIFIVYLSGKGMNHAVYPVFYLPRLSTEAGYSSINLQAYFSTVANSGIFNQVIVWYDLQTESRTAIDGLLPEFGSPLPLKQAEGLLMGYFSEPVLTDSNVSQTVENNKGGLFTEQLLEGLNGKAADNNSITANSISQYIKEALTNSNSVRIGVKDFVIIKSRNTLLQKIAIRFTPDCIGKKFRLLDNTLQLIDEVTVTNTRVEYELMPESYTAEVPELSLQKAFSVQPSAIVIEVNVGWRFLNKWICVIGSRYSLSNEKEATAQALGTFLADKGYGLITGGWPGVDKFVMEAYCKVVEKQGAEENALQQIIAGDQPIHYKKGVIEKALPASWNDAVIDKSVAIIAIGGKNFAYRLFERSRAFNLPFIPLPHTKGDSLKIYNELLTSDHSLLPMEELRKLGKYETINEAGFFDTLTAILDVVAVGKTRTR